MTFTSKLSKTMEHHARRRWVVLCRTGEDRYRYYNEYSTAAAAAQEFHGEMFRRIDPLRFRTSEEQAVVDALIDPTEGL